MNLVGLVNLFSIYSNAFGPKKWYIIESFLIGVYYVTIMASKQKCQSPSVWNLNS